MEICGFELAKKLEEKGFKEKCYAYYSPVNNELRYNIYQFRGGSLYDCLYSYNSLPKEVVTSDSIDAPTISQVLKWLREEKEVYVSVIPEYNEFNPVKGVTYRLEVAYWKDNEFGYETVEWLDKETYTIITFDSYEKALLEGIEYVIDNNLI